MFRLMCKPLSWKKKCNSLITQINEHKFDQRSKVCKHLLANPMHRFNFKQLEILWSIVSQKKLHLLGALLIQEHQPDLNIVADSRGSIGAIAPPKTCKSDFIHHDFEQFGKHHSRCKAILPWLVLSPQYCEVHFTSLAV